MTKKKPENMDCLQEQAQIRRVVLAAINARYSHTSLSIRLLRQACLRDRRGTYSLYLFEQTINDSHRSLLRKLVELDGHIYAFSCYIWNRTLIDPLSRDLKKIKPDCQILLGGPEVGRCAETYLQDNQHIDAVMTGEGEPVLPVLLDRLTAGHSMEQACFDLSGIRFRDAQGQIRGLQDSQPTDPDKWPFAYDEEERFALKDRILYYESSRGCPFGCTYCLSALDRTVRFRSLDRVFSELEQLIQSDVRLVKFVDRTFNCNPERARRIWLFLINRFKQAPYRTCFHFEITAELLETACLELLAEAPDGLFQFEIGVQSCQPDVLAAINRPGQVDRMSKAVTALKSSGSIHLHLDLIAGLPGETLQQIAQSFDIVLKLYPHRLQLGFLKVLPGSLMQKQARDRGMAWQSKPPYEVLYSDALSFSDLSLLKRVEQQLDYYYNSEQYRLSLSGLLEQERSAFEFFRDLALYYQANGWEERQIGRQDRWRLLQDFCINKRPWHDNKKLRDCMIWDYLSTGQKDSPSWQQPLERSESESDCRLVCAGKVHNRTLFPKAHRIRLERFQLEPAGYVRLLGLSFSEPEMARADENTVRTGAPNDRCLSADGAGTDKAGWLAAVDLTGACPVLLWQEPVSDLI